MQTIENLLLQNYSTEFLDITYKWSLGICNKSLLNGGATYIIGEIIAEANLNIAIVMQTFENLSYSPKLFNRYNIAHTWSLGMCN